MKTALAFAVALLGASSSLASEGEHTARAQPADVVLSVDEAVARVQSVYGKAIALTTDFEQRFSIKSTHQAANARGHVEWHTPGDVKWRYANRSGSGSGMCTTSQCGAALAFLPTAGPLSAKFTLKVISGPQMQFPDGFVLLGTPRAAIPGCAKALFYVQTKTSEVSRVVLVDEHGNRDRVDFLNMRIWSVP